MGQAQAPAWAGNQGFAVIARDDRPAVEPARREIGEQEVCADVRDQTRITAQGGMTGPSPGELHVFARSNLSAGFLVSQLKQADDHGYRARLAACLARERLTSRELTLVASAVRAYNRQLYWQIRCERANRSA